MYDFDKMILDLGVFTQVVYQLTSLNALLDKVWLSPPTVVRDKSVHEVLSSVVCFSSSEEIKIVCLTEKKGYSFMFSNRFGIFCMFYSIFLLGMQFILFLLKQLNWFNPPEWL